MPNARAGFAVAGRQSQSYYSAAPASDLAPGPLPRTADAKMAMLDTLRKSVASIAVKVLLVLLILSFVAWGIGDVFSPGASDEWAAKVGDVDIHAYELGNEYQRARARLRVELGTDIGPEQARELGLPSMVLNRMVDSTLVRLGATDLGFTAGNDLVRARIRADTRFFNEFGVFDSAVFNDILRGLGLTESGYVSEIRSQVIGNQLVGSIGAGVAAPRPLVDHLYRHRLEQRVAEILRIPDSSVEEPTVSEEPTLRTFHQDNAAVFTAPEFRALTVVAFEAKDLAPEMAVSQAELDEAFEDRGDEFIEPERRTLRQMLLPDADAAKRARERLNGRDDFAVVAKEEAGLDADVLAVGSTTRVQLVRDLGVEIANAVFAAAPGSTTAPLQSPLGWHLIEVSEVSAGHAPPRSEIDEKLRTEIALEKAVDALFHLANRLEDALGGGASLEEAARSLALTVRKLDAVDPAGLDSTGTVIADLSAGLLETAYATEAGTESALTETGSDGYFIVRVDSITPPTLRPFEEVREEVVAAWLAKRRGEVVGEEAQSIAQRVRGGTALSTIAGERGLDVETSSPFNRNGAGASPGMSVDLVEQLFSAQRGDVVVGRGVRSSIVARLVRVVDADTGTNAQNTRQALARQLAAGIGNDLVSQLTNALRDRYPVSINTRVVDELY